MKCRHEYYRIARNGKTGRCTGCRESFPAETWRHLVDRPPIGYQWGLAHNGEPRIVKVPPPPKMPPAKCQRCGVGVTKLGLTWDERRDAWECSTSGARRCERRRMRALLDEFANMWRSRLGIATHEQDRGNADGALRALSVIEEIRKAVGK